MKIQILGPGCPKCEKTTKIVTKVVTKVVQNYLNWNENPNGAAVLKKVCGTLDLLGGLYMIYTAP